MKKHIFAASAAAAAFVGFGSSAVGAQPPTQSGLVNVYAEDTTVQVPIAVAANVCGVDVNVLASNVGDSPVECTAEGVAIAQDSDGPGNGPVNQQGLVNVALVDTTVQVPVGVAANICGLDVNALASLVGDAPVNCDAIGTPDANA